MSRLPRYFTYCTSSGSLRLNFSVIAATYGGGAGPFSALARERVARKGKDHRSRSRKVAPMHHRDHLQEPPHDVRDPCSPSVATGKQGRPHAYP